jgi:hypothetical protein
MSEIESLEDTGLDASFLLHWESFRWSLSLHTRGDTYGQGSAWLW